nr:MAG: hypothetical protein [Microvirus sp.]
MKRHRIGRSRSRKMFSRGASHVHKRNLSTANPMRGGIRL